MSTTIQRRVDALERTDEPKGPLVLFPGDPEPDAPGREVMRWPVRPPPIEARLDTPSKGGAA